MRRKPRQYQPWFKREVVEELLSGRSNINQLSRKHEISKALISYWRDQYLKGGLQEDTGGNVRDLKRRIAELEQMVGRLTMDNELLKKALTYLERREKGISLLITGKNSEQSGGDASS